MQSYAHTRTNPATVPSAKLLFFYLLGAFLILSPISVCNGVSPEWQSTVKWTRMGCLLLAIVIGLHWMRIPRGSEASGRLLLFSVVFCLAAIWSTNPVWGLLFKGMFVASVLAGITLARTLRQPHDFLQFARAMTLTSMMAIGLVAYTTFVLNGWITRNGRLFLFELNPNLLAQSCVVFALLNLFHLLFRDRRIWRLFAIFSLLTMLTLIVLSGSRGAFLMIASGMAILIPMVRGKRGGISFHLLAGIVLAVVLIIWFLTVDDQAETFGMDAAGGVDSSQLRIIEEAIKDTRFKMWSIVLRDQVYKHPILGVGWFHRGNQWSLVQSAYLQVLVESGLVGTFFLGSFLLLASRKIRSALALGRRSTRLHSTLLVVFAATLFAMLLHGLAESSMIAGASPNSMILAFSVAQLDQLLAPSRRHREPLARASGVSEPWQTLASPTPARTAQENGTK